MPKRTRSFLIRERRLAQRLSREPRSVLQRFPLLFTLLTTFGLVATLYGFEGIINTLPFLADNPIILLLVGLATLAATGTLYKKLSA